MIWETVKDAGWHIALYSDVNSIKQIALTKMNEEQR